MKWLAVLSFLASFSAYSYNCPTELRAATSKLSQSTIEHDLSVKFFNKALQNVSELKYTVAKTNADSAKVKSNNAISTVNTAISKLETVIKLCEDPEKKMAEEYLVDAQTHASNVKVNDEQVNELILLLDRVLNGDKNAYCYGFTYCPNGATVSCYAYGPSCSWQVTRFGVVCRGFDQWGNWGEFWGRCF
ncbi:MAG: hypothetical protein COW00_12270 [Bdellovibrio sp. CG12_big_fil_rev_8_21_14_0_65_39_13]|nr:MAG: hypothetical protein COW78_03635 [Bdellovibrio sp. CG22_combo_CG10-13_8_21_14_all_39_27]PIQ59100.1 MAG: hypothetical protein COW00_12270 [Bdellovibrio sp. CG12_big_fil_rev_8_21_14_0_65_39_13]PIR35209.1 MAG: hypothetical protein COV37_09880 [Bdellovibrio sp. CG11_big_fil_rev_8_21_14_0_20_39_38]